MTAKREIFRLLLMLLVLIFTSSCAVLDISTLDSAVPLPKGKIQIGIYEALGIDLTTMSYINDQVEDNGELGALPMPVTGVALSYGVDNENELGGKVWLSAFNGGGRLYLKHLLRNEGKNYISLIPGISYIKVLDEYQDDFDKRYEAIGSELQLLYTHQALKSISFTSVLRCNYNRYQETIIHDQAPDEIYGPYDLFNIGIRQNMELRLGSLILVPEIGIDCVPVINGRFSVLPNAGIGLGLEL